MPPNPSSKQQRLLLVDLSERERHELSEQLCAADFEVTIALNHADACLRLLTWRPHGIIVDGDLSSADLPELVKVVRGSTPFILPILVLCGSPQSPQLDATILRKPVGFPELLAALRASLVDRDDALPSGWTTPRG